LPGSSPAIPGSLGNRLPVARLIGSRLPNSLLLASLTAAFAVPLALTPASPRAIWRGSWYDRVIGIVSVSIVSVPSSRRDAGGADLPR